MSTTCPNDHQNSDGSAFCNICGSPIEKPELVDAHSTERRSAAFRSESDEKIIVPPTTGSGWRRLPQWAKIAIPVGGTLLVAGIALGVIFGTGGTHVPSEADYRHGFEDIATVVIANGGPWEVPAAYPAPLSSSDEERFSQVKTQLLDYTCSVFAKGEASSKQSIDLAVALAKDNGDSVDYALVTNQAVLEAAANYICPQYSDVANSVSGYVNALRVINS